MSSENDAALARPTAEARPVSELVALARDGKLRMPRFQRGFRWDERDVTKFFDSLWRGFPVGSLLLWERSAPAQGVSFGSFTVAAEEEQSALWVVDGQQRLTALVATLTAHGGALPPFELYFDLHAADFARRGSRRSVPPHWLPFNVLLDTNRLLDELMTRRAEGLGDAGVNLARELATRMGDYRIPLAIVSTGDERVLREIFHRSNSAGRRMTASEVFRALHAALDPGDPGDLRTLIDDVGAKGFGALREDTVLRCVLAVRGGDVYRSFEGEFAAGESPAETFTFASDALERVFAFLRDDASIPHVRALPYVGVLPILTRFFALHPEPHSRTRNLLRRWIWRGSMAWGRDVGALRRAVQDVVEDEQASIDNLLGGLGADRQLAVDLDAVQLNKAAAKLNVALLTSLHPLDLRDASPVDVGALLEDDGPGALVEVVAPSTPQLAGRILHPAVDEGEVAPLLRAADSAVLASHAVPGEAVDALMAGDAGRFVTLRGKHLEERLREQRTRLAEPQADDRPPLSSLVVADP